MDLDNENGQETPSGTTEIDSGSQPSDSTEHVTVKDFVSSESADNGAQVDSFVGTDATFAKTDTKLASCDFSDGLVNSSNEDANQGTVSPTLNDNVGETADGPNVQPEGETSIVHGASPLSSCSDRDIALGGEDSGELVGGDGSSNLSNERVSESGDALESNVSGDANQGSVSPTPNDNVGETADGPNVQPEGETSIVHGASPLSSCLDREIALGGEDSGELVGGDGSSNLSNEKVSESGDTLESTGSGECLQEDVTASIGSCPEGTEETKLSGMDDACGSKGSPAASEERLMADSSAEDIQKKKEDDANLQSVQEESMDNVNEGANNIVDEKDPPPAGDETIESAFLEQKNKDEDDEKQSSFSSVIDTSMFPKPPREKESNVVVANCFELDMTKSISGCDLVPNDNPQASDETLDAVNSAFPGPSDDREDISDEELELEYSGNAQLSKKDLESDPGASSVPNTPGDTQISEAFVHRADNISLNSGDVGDIIDLKLDDVALKSIGSSCEKVSNEDLEAVSDDELPNAPHVSDLVLDQNSTSLLDEREEVSSSEDEEMDHQPPPQHLEATPISSEDEFPAHNEEESAAPAMDGEKGFASSSQQSDSHVRLESLEAEPISDEEDNNIVSEGTAKPENSFDDGEAGEIKSPVLGSPISEQGDMMLGEVEPVSADESQDTDGELPSGDEAEKDSHSKKFESIDSDEDIPGEIQEPEHSPRGNGKNKSLVASESVPKSSGGDKDGEYMEAISDEENLDSEDPDQKQSEELSKPAPGRTEESQNPIEKGHIPTSFNEHQVELDYEEGYGEEGGAESKDDEAKAVSKPTDGNEKEEGLASDKDEGELSDDDCEEGEIKEPGQRKMFIKPICRFFQRGHCTWGISCRFLHPGVNDKGNYQMIEVPGFKPVGIHARLGIPGGYQDQQQQQPPPEEEPLPPPPMPDVPHVETAWERGLRIAKEQRKKASERKEQEPDFEEKRLNLSMEEDRELNKENERTPRIIPKDPYYDQQAYEVDEYYKIPRDPWHTGHYENFEVRHHHQPNSYSPPPPHPYREKPPLAPPPMRYTRPLSPPIDKFGRHKDERPEPPQRPPHHEPIRVSDYPPPPPAPVNKHPDEWIDPWRRSKSPKHTAKPRSRSRGRRTRRSLSDSSDSSRSSRSSSGSSRSSRSGSSSSSSRSRSPEPAPPGVDRNDRHERYGGDQPRSMVSVRGPPEGRGGGGGGGGGYNNRYNNDNNYRYGGRGNQGYSSNFNRGGSNVGGGGRNPYNSRQDNMYQSSRIGGGDGNGPVGYGSNNYTSNYRGYGGGRGGGGDRGGRGGGFNNRGPRGRYGGGGRNFSPSRGGRNVTPDRPLPYTRPRPKSRSSSRSSSSRSRSRSRSKSSDSSRSRSSSNSSRSSSSSSSSGGSADSDHLYRDLGSPSKAGRHPPHASHKKRPGMDSRKDSRNTKSNHHPSSSSQMASRHPPAPSGIDGSRMAHHPRSPPHSRASGGGGGGGGDPKYSQIPLPPPPSSSSRGDTKYASRNAPQPPVKAKDPLKVVGQKSNIKLTLLPKQQQQTNLGDRPNPLASPPHKRRMSDRDPSPSSPPPSKRPNLSMQASSLRMAVDKAAKVQMRLDKVKSPPPGSLPPPPSSSSSSSLSAQRSKNPMPPVTSPQKQPAGKSRPSDFASAKPTAKAPTGVSAPSSSANPQSARSKKSMSSRREELLKQLKAVEDAIARKKVKMS